jgi:glycosyltransferase involved in cell wall biosynthesis
VFKGANCLLDLSSAVDYAAGLRVLVVHNRYRSAQPSGENTVVDEECRLLEKHGCDVRRLDISSDEIAGWSRCKRAALPARVIWSREGSRLVSDAIARTSPAVVHIHNTFPLLSPAVFRAARRSGTRVVHTLHNFRPLCPAAIFLRDGKVCEDCLGRLPFPSVQHGCYRDSRAATLPIAVMDGLHRGLGTWTRNVDAFVFPSDFARQKYVQAGWPSDRMIVKPNTVEDDGPTREGPGEFFLCLSRLTEEKGVDTLLVAWHLAFPDGGPTLRIVGAGDDEPILRHLAGGVSTVAFVGAVDQARARSLISRAKALIVPSRCYEVFPRTIVEAYAAGVPVIGSRLGGISEVVEHEKTGLLFESESPEGLAEAIKRLDDPDLSVALGREARRAYEGRYHPDITTKQLLRIYEDRRVHHP